MVKWTKHAKRQLRHILYEIKSDQLIEVLAVIHKRRHEEPDDIPREQ